MASEQEKYEFLLPATEVSGSKWLQDTFLFRMTVRTFNDNGPKHLRRMLVIDSTFLWPLKIQQQQSTSFSDHVT